MRNLTPNMVASGYDRSCENCEAHLFYIPHQDLPDSIKLYVVYACIVCDAMFELEPGQGGCRLDNGEADRRGEVAYDRARVLGKFPGTLFEDGEIIDER